MRIAYYIRTDIQHLVPMIRLYQHLGGLVVVRNKRIAHFAGNKYPDYGMTIRAVASSTEARQVCRKAGIDIVVYIGYQMVYWGRGVQIFHGASDKNYDEDRRVYMYDRVLVPGQRTIDRIRKAGLRKYPERFRLVGYPKFDPVINGALTYTPVFNNGRPTILYAPTWISQDSKSKFVFSPHGESSLPLWGHELVRRIPDHWNLIIKYHSRINTNRTEVYARIGNEIQRLGFGDRVMTVWDDDITPYMAQSDLLISDISAVCYEWFHFDRPIVFANPAPEHYRPSDDVSSNTYAWRAGSVLNRPDQIVPVIKSALAEDPHRELRKQLLEYAFYKPDGKAAERQVNEIRQLYDETKDCSLAANYALNVKRFLYHSLFRLHDPGGNASQR